MALTKGTVRRATVTDAGADFLTLEDGTNRRAQAVGSVDDLGNHSGIKENPLYVRIGEADPAVNSGAVSVREYSIMVNPGFLAELRVQLDPNASAARWPCYSIPFQLRRTIPSRCGLFWFRQRARLASPFRAA